MKFKEWLNFWLDNYIRPSAQIRTCRKYADIARIHIEPELGDFDVNDITPLVLQRLVTDMLKSGNSRTNKGLSVNTVNTTLTVVQNALKTACEAGVIAAYTADNVRRPRLREKKVECFTIREQKKIEQHILQNERRKLYGVIIALYTGLRVGELLAVKWCDVDFQHKLLSVNKSCYDDKDESGNFERKTGAPKTENSNRVIPIPTRIIGILKQLKKSSKCEYIIEEKGKPVSVRSYQMSFQLLLKRLKIRHRGFHALRHTFATRAIECGMDVKTLSEILGHKNPAITLRRYVHSLPEHKREMMNRIGKMLETDD